MNARLAFVREPERAFPRCLSTHTLQHTVSISIARKQHSHYCKALEELGLEIVRIPSIHTYPDSCFVEDTVVIHNRKGLISRMGAPSRIGEEVSTARILADYIDITRVYPPGTVEGGDVIHLPDRLICGITQRTNENGIKQLGKELKVNVIPYRDSSIIHLKTYVTFMDQNTIICTESVAQHPVFASFEKLILDSENSYAANTLMVNGVVLMPKGYPKAFEMVKEAGFEISVLEMSEFQKCDGALTCLSILL